MAPALAGHGIEIASWAPATGPGAPDEYEALEAALDWAGLIVLRRSYRTAHVCVECRARSFDRAEMRGHAASTGHSVMQEPQAAQSAVMEWAMVILQGNGLYELSLTQT